MVYVRMLKWEEWTDLCCNKGCYPSPILAFIIVKQLVGFLGIFKCLDGFQIISGRQRGFETISSGKNVLRSI